MNAPGSAAFALLLVVIALVGLERLWELRLTARNLARRGPGGSPGDSPGTWRLLVLANVALLVLPPLEALWRGHLAPPALFAGALVLLALAQLLRLWCQRSLGLAWDARGVVHPETRVVASGPYRYLRHPNYLAVLVEVCALPLAAGAWWSLCLLLPAQFLLTSRRIATEEAALAQLEGYAEALGGKGGLWPRARLPRTRSSAVE